MSLHHSHKWSIIVQNKFSLHQESEQQKPIILDWNISANELETQYTGAYTTARTVGQRSVLEYNTHLERLATSTNGIYKTSFTASQINNALLPSLKVAIKSFIDHHAQENIPTQESSATELKVSVLITKDDIQMSRDSSQGKDTKEDDYFSLFAHICDLPSHPLRGVMVEARTAHRNNPTVKDTQWVRERKPLEAAKASECNEVLLLSSPSDLLKDHSNNDHKSDHEELAGEDAVVTEGSQSNFFAVDEHGRLLTAPENLVLNGTIRRIVLAVCKELDPQIPVILESPSIKSVQKWRGAFITSTSRLVLPIRTIRFPEGHSSGIEEFTFESIDPMITKIQQRVYGELQQRSVTIL